MICELRECQKPLSQLLRSHELLNFAKKEENSRSLVDLVTDPKHYTPSIISKSAQMPSIARQSFDGVHFLVGSIFFSLRTPSIIQRYRFFGW
mmetsp:Transcript_8552/g.12084  ORF Transcript_8552/g.12084 Transcript_8552/m.12084 type:complete len:92 (+) Transcript_8552:146-421(+)